MSIGVANDEIKPCVYIHESYKEKVEEVLKFWSRETGISKSDFGTTCFTKTVYTRKSKRKNISNYVGQLRIRVKKSTDLNRKIAGWIDGICIKSGVS